MHPYNVDYFPVSYRKHYMKCVGIIVTVPKSALPTKSLHKDANSMQQ